MIKAKGTQPDGREILIFGITEDNVQRLQAGKPIMIHGKDMNIPMDVSIVYAKTMEDLAKLFTKQMDKDTVVHRTNPKEDAL